MTLAYYLRTWRLTRPVPLADTATSRVYTAIRDGETVALKILKPAGVRDEANGAAALHYFNGVGAIRLLQSDSNAHLLEYAGDESLASLVAKNEDDEATENTAAVLRQLHGSRGSRPPELTPLPIRFQSLFQKAQGNNGTQQNSIYAKAARVAQELLSHPSNASVLHGDIHHQNILYSPQRGWLAIDPKGLYGETTYDAANTLLNPAGMDHLILSEDRLFRRAAILARCLNVDRSRLLAFTFAHAALSASWSLEDGEDPSLALGIASILERKLISP